MRASGVFVVALAACGSQPAGPAITFDPCEPVVVAADGATDAQRASITAAIAMWHADGVPGLALGDASSAQIPILFRDAMPAMYGFYDAPNATVYINLAITDDNERAITIAHELGHALALVHVPPSTRESVMNPGNLTIAPNASDTAALAQTWGSCP